LATTTSRIDAAAAKSKLVRKVIFPASLFCWQRSSLMPWAVTPPFADAVVVAPPVVVAPAVVAADVEAAVVAAAVVAAVLESSSSPHAAASSPMARSPATAGAKRLGTRSVVMWSSPVGSRCGFAGRSVGQWVVT
jgi:hypothetical protein